MSTGPVEAQAQSAAWIEQRRNIRAIRATLERGCRYSHAPSGLGDAGNEDEDEVLRRTLLQSALDDLEAIQSEIDRPYSQPRRPIHTDQNGVPLDLSLETRIALIRLRVNTLLNGGQEDATDDQDEFHAGARRDPEAGSRDAAPAYAEEATAGEEVLRRAEAEGPPGYVVDGDEHTWPERAVAGPVAPAK